MANSIHEEFTQVHAKLDEILEFLKPAPPVVKPLGLGVVSYFRPGTVWDTTLAAKPRMTLINPGSGPGPSAEQVYIDQVAKCKAAGVPVLGYVHTRYGARPAAEVKLDIDRHIAWYKVDGIFVDTTSNRLEHVPYYADLAAYIRAKGGKVVLNPGTRTIEEYMPHGDWIVVAETDVTAYSARAPSAFEAKYPGRFWHMIHTCPATQLDAVIARATAQGAGLLFVTDDIMPNPYDRLPSYFAQLVTKLA